MEKNVFAHLLRWYLWLVPKEILRAWGNVLWFNLEYFSLFFLLNTLLSPWRRTQWSYERGFDIGKYFEVFIGNLISRLLGAIIRFGIILSGAFIETILVFAGPAAFVLWYVFPFLLLFALSQGITGIGIALGGGLWLFSMFQRNWRSTRSLRQTKTLAEFLTKEERELRFVFARLLLDPRDMISRLQGLPPSPEFQEMLQKAKTPEEVLLWLAQHHAGFQQVLIQVNVNPKDVENVIHWILSLKAKIRQAKAWWSKKNLRKHGTLARQWASGFSPLLDEFSHDLNEQARRQNFPQLIGHEKELLSLERTLARSEMKNALLVGEPGSGRKSIVLELAKRSSLGETLPELNYKRVLELDIPTLLSRVGSPSQREAALNQIFQEAAGAGNIILVLDEFHNFVGSSRQQPGTIDVTGILAKYLSSPSFPIIAMTTFSGLHLHIEQNPSLLSLLEKIEVQEISESEALEVLQNVTPAFEQKYRRFISYAALRDIISLSQKYIQATPLPKKALDMLDESMVFLSQGKDKVLLPSHIASIVSEKTQIPVGELQAKEKEMLLNLEERIHKRIVNQEEAVREVASALRRARTEIGKRTGPMGSFLFLGPTGVGKTETAKALAAIYFGSEQRMIRLDMSEFQNVQDVERLLGSPTQEGLLTTQVRENPFALVLLDEMEKAHPNILNLFLQVLDEGHITDGIGRKVNFQHTIIIATSNAGYQLILQALKDKTDFAVLKQEIIDFLFKEAIFRPEFLNRFDGVILFQPLSKEHLFQIAELMLSKLKKNLLEKGIEFIITQPLKEKLAGLGHDPKFGARNMRRVIQDTVENAFAVSLLRNEFTRGDKVEVDAQDFTIHKL